MIDRYFAIAASGSTIPRELRAGLTTFLTMSYVLVVNPAVLGNAIVIPDGFAKLLVVTALAAAIGSLLMGIVARYPFAQAPGMGLNAYFAFSVVLGQKIPWQTALGAVAISGTLFVLLSVIGVRQAIVRAVPQHLKLSITAGIGMFLAFIGLKNAGLIITSPATFVTLGSFASSGALIAIAGLVITAVLIVRRAPGAILIGIVASTVIAIATRAHVYVGPHDTFVPFGGFAHGLLALPVAPTDLIGALDVRAALGLGVASVVFTFFFVDFFDATGTLVALANKAGLLDARGELPRSRRTFAMDGVAAVIGAYLGTSTTTAYIESASGIGEGGRTGLVAVTTGVLFLASIVLWPLAAAIPAAATAPALIIVGALMLDGLRAIDWDDYPVLISSFLTVIMMPLSFSIANGVSFGVISYAAIMLLVGRGRAVDPLLYAVAAVLVARYAWIAS
jgi:AGZA family xanthine/uracil permease-like MFS transporter